MINNISGISAFAQQVAQLTRPAAPHRQRISQADYVIWRQQFTWDALQGQRYAQSFCNHFNITDYVLYYTRDPVRADKYIQEHYLD